MPRKKTITEYFIKVRHATEEDIPHILKIAHQYPQELGFVRKVSLQESITRNTLLVADYKNATVVGFVNYHTRKNGWNTIYEIATHKEHTNKGIGRFLLQAVPTPTQLKCTVDNPANVFYEKNGFIKVSTEKGRKRELNVWKRKYLNILCRGSSKIIKDIPNLVGMAYGTRHTEKPLYQPHMVDIRWKGYDWEDYLTKLRAWKPVFALAPDFEDISQRKQLYRQLRDLKKLGILRIGVCPKFDGAIQHIPSWCVICVSIPTNYAGFLPNKKELEGRKIHLLGGSPQKQLKYIKDNPELSVVSVDGNALAAAARYGTYYSMDNKWRHSDMNLYNAAYTSAENIMKVFGYKEEEMKNSIIKERFKRYVRDIILVCLEKENLTYVELVNRVQIIDSTILENDICLEVWALRNHSILIENSEGKLLV